MASLISQEDLNLETATSHGEWLRISPERLQEFHDGVAERVSKFVADAIQSQKPISQVQMMSVALEEAQTPQEVFYLGLNIKSLLAHLMDIR